MQRKTKKGIFRKYGWYIIINTLMILIGFFLAILPHFPHVEYDALQTKEVTVTEFKRFFAVRGGTDYDYIRTTDGEKYNLSGDYDRGKLEELLKEGTTATIKWYKNKPFRTLLAEEMYVDGDRVVTYDNDKQVDGKSFLILGSCFIVFGTGGFIWLWWYAKANRKRKKKRV
ncbi:MAG: hypothetical protein IJB25_11980 [Clostridia bacterium]|nr:hypothetical protein [Clostridia bacterium]